MVGDSFTPEPASSRVNPLPQGPTEPECSTVPVGAGLPAKRPAAVTPKAGYAETADR
ncbi:hypothetical protein RK21_03653 [Pseudomonas plecoglossicida]|nr:hypothetical protein RK21_03653 [Pseudomonas plecoglossicida]